MKKTNLKTIPPKFKVYDGTGSKDNTRLSLLKPSKDSTSKTQTKK
ncbi:hypothetical protein [Clostridium cochlearium]|uniref:Uncharacterized protein n=1 Tax=Clostridium cochlearium TaxID=1494 RepID=A0A2X2W7R9_CLOCO|nr:hypothetical protein [Clostridium cochlearium]SQB33693.1 Uncharacterised protein [Clostridium cochlearium]